MAQKPRRKVWEIVGSALGLVEDKTGLQAAPMPQQAPMQTTAPSAIGQALAQKPREIPLKRPGLSAPTEIGMPTTPERLGDPAATYDPYSIGGTRPGHAALRAFGPESAMGKIGTALATDPTVQAHVGQIAMALGAKSPRGVGYQLGQSIVKSAEGQQYQMLQEYFGDIISGREPRADFNLEDLTLSPERMEKAFMGKLEEALMKARGGYYEAGTELQRARAKDIGLRTPEWEEQQRLEAQRLADERAATKTKEGRDFQVLQSTVNRMARERSAYLGNKDFFMQMGEEGIFEKIPVTWDEEKDEQDYQELLARGQAVFGVDLDLLSDTVDDTTITSFIQELIDQGMPEPEIRKLLEEMGVK